MRESGLPAVQAVLLGQIEEQVVAGRLLAQRRLRVVGEEKLGERTAAAIDLLRSCHDVHAVGRRADAGGGEDPLSDVDHAHPADAHRTKARIVAEDRDLDPELPGRLPEGGPLGDGDRASVDGQIDRAGLHILGRWVLSDCHHEPLALLPFVR